MSDSDPMAGISNLGLPLDVILRYEVTLDQAERFARVLPANLRVEDVDRWERLEGVGAERVIYSRLVEAWGDVRGDSLPGVVIGCLGSMPLPSAAALTYLNWPRMSLVDSVIVLEDFSSRNLDAWVGTFGGDRRQAEAMVNHVHLWDWFDGDDSAESVFEFLGKLLAFMWQLKADRDFPQRPSTVTFSIGGYGPEVTITSA